jgi:hypothetical protein
LLLCAVLFSWPGATLTFPSRAAQADDAAAPKAELRLAVFDVDVVKGLEAEPAAVTDQIVTMLSARQGVVLVNRDQLSKVADEHKIALSGLVDNASAVQLGKFVSAKYVVVGRASRIGSMQYIVLKFIEVETTIQTTVAARAKLTDGVEGLLDALQEPLEARLTELQQAKADPADMKLAELSRQVKSLRGKVFLVSVSEDHVGRPLADPAAQLAVVARLQVLGCEAIVPHEPVPDWKKTLAETGVYDQQAIDYLIEGEGTSAFAAQLQGLTSCRARVELRVVPVPGHAVQMNNRGVGARADLVETLAAKAALEDAATDAIDTLLPKLAEAQEKPVKPKK